MSFSLLDRIVELHSSESLTAIKSPTLAEEYLQDHFPLLPVMPGVMMLEAMYQASAWLSRESDNFAYSMVLMKEARAVKYSGFVRPGETLRIQSQLQKQNAREMWFKSSGTVNEETVVSARLILEKYNLADDDATADVTDEQIRHQMRQNFRILYPVEPSTASS